MPHAASLVSVDPVALLVSVGFGARETDRAHREEESENRMRVGLCGIGRGGVPA